MARFIKLPQISGNPKSGVKTKDVYFNTDFIVRFEDVDESEEKYWGFAHCEITTPNGVVKIKMRAEEVMSFINK